MHFQSPILLPSAVVPIGKTSLERRILRSLYLNNYFISDNQKTDSSKTFSFRVIPPFGPGFRSIPVPFNVSQPKLRPNILVIHGGLAISPSVQQEFGGLPDGQRRQILSEIGRELNLLRGIEFSGVSDPLTQIEIRKNVILSRTGEDSFYTEELLAFVKAIHAVEIILDRRLP